MFDVMQNMKRYLTVLVLFAVPGLGTANAQTYNATRVDGRPATPAVSDPIIDESTFASVNAASQDNAGFNNSSLPFGSTNINGPSIIRVPDWIPAAERVNPNAQYYMYFGHHIGFSIRMAWSDSLTGDWTLFNAGDAPDRAWGTAGNNTGTQTPFAGVLTINGGQLAAMSGSDFVASNHISSPEVIVDNVNQRIAMYFHSTTQFTGGPGNGTGQVTWVSTSKYGLNFNPVDNGGEPGQGMREVLLTRAYARPFEVGGQTFAYTNAGELWKAPLTNDAGNINTIANADSEGGFWNPSGTNTTASWWEKMDDIDNPLFQLYVQNGQGGDDARHSAVYTRSHIDPSDTNVYLFYSARFDTPESVFLTVIDTANGSTNTSDWTAIGQRVMLAPELDWEGGDLPLTTSVNGVEINVRQLRDPDVFEDDQGTSDPSDDKLYLFYSGEGEEGIGFAELQFDANTSNTAFPQGDLGQSGPPSQITFFDPAAGNGPEPTENVIFDGIFENGGTVGTLIDATATQGARGHNFVIGAPGTATEITGVTFQANGGQSFSAGDEITIAIFSGNNFAGASQNNITPTGLAAAPGITLLYEETFQLPGTVPSQNYLIIDFASAVTVDSGDTLGMMVFTNTAFEQLEGTGNGGGRLQYRDSGVNGPSGSRDLRFSIFGQVLTGGGDILPSMFTRFRGVDQSNATLSDFVDSDDVSASFSPGFTLNSSEAPVWLIFDGNGSAAEIRVESNANTPGLAYTVEAFNWNAGSYDVVGIQTESFNTDQVVQFAITPADHVDSGGDVRTRVGWRRAGFTLLFPWQVNVDQVVWTQ